MAGDRLGAKSEIENALLCPSAQPDWDSSVIIGVVDGKSPEPRIIPLTNPEPVRPELLALAESVPPAAVFRFAAPCEETRCVHFHKGACSLVARVVEHLDPVPEGVPYCRIRRKCRWWAQEGKAACLRCPVVITERYPSSDAIHRIVTPPR
jgi:hypothetical protein